MPTNPDPLAIITSLLLDANAKLDKLVTLTPAPSPQSPLPQDDVDALLAKFAPPTPEEWSSRYSTPVGEPIPQMTAPDEEEALFRARAGYNWRGTCALTTPDTQWRRAAVSVIANATDQTVKDPKGHPEDYYYTGAGMLDPTFACFAVLTGLVEPRSFWIRTFEPGPPLQKWVGYTIAGFLRAQGPLISGGDPGPGHG